MSKRRSEIMAWLREEARVCEAAEDPNEECYEMLHEAANEIEALETEVERLRESRREALELLAQLAAKIGSPSLAQMARKARELGV